MPILTYLDDGHTPTSACLELEKIPARLGLVDLTLANPIKVKLPVSFPVNSFEWKNHVFVAYLSGAAEGPTGRPKMVGVKSSLLRAEPRVVPEILTDGKVLFVTVPPINSM